MDPTSLIIGIGIGATITAVAFRLIDFHKHITSSDIEVPEMSPEEDIFNDVHENKSSNQEQEKGEQQ